MKYLITESQAKIAATFHKLDMKKFIQIKMDGNIYFVKSEWDEYAQIRYHPKDRWCTIHYDLADEVSKFFSLDYEDSISVINKWIEDKLGIKSINVEVASPLVGY